MATFTVWAKHDKVKSAAWRGYKHGWIPLLWGQTGQAATNDLLARQDRVRRSGEPVRFRICPDGEQPGKDD